MNIGEAIDGMIGILAPEAGLRRARARMATGMIKRRYDGARADRLTKGWTTAGTSADAEIWPDRAKLANRARDLVRNNPHAKRAVDIMVSHIVGTGIRPIPKSSRQMGPNADANAPPDPTGFPRDAAGMNKVVSRLWRDWSKSCDAGGRYPLATMQAMMVRAMVEGGEGLIRFRQDGGRPDIPPLRLQMLEADYLDERSVTGAADANAAISQGIEMDDRGRRLAYYLYPQHPGDSSWHPTRTVGQRIPANEVIHLFLAQRLGQNRGVSWLHPVIGRMKHLDEFEEAELIQKRIQACTAVFVTRPDDSGGALNPTVATDGSGENRVAFDPGLINYMKPGENVEFLDPSKSPDSDFTMRQMRAIAVGIGPTYHQLSGDNRGANFSSTKAGSIEFYQLVEQIQLLTVVPLMLNRIWDEFITSCRMVGLLPRGVYDVTWILPERQSIQPDLDVKTDIAEVRAGFASLSEKQLKRGNDPQELVDTIAADNELLDDKGLLLDTDPRNNTLQGQPRDQSQGKTAAPAPTRGLFHASDDDEPEDRAADADALGVDRSEVG